MSRSASMPFGAQVTDHKSVRFRLWAPSASKVWVSLSRDGRNLYLPMHALEDGWFELETDIARPGDLYRYSIDQRLEIPDPASRYNPQDVHGPSQIVDPRAYHWNDANWRGRQWAEAVVYELHVGAFTPEGTFKAVSERLDYLADLGITAIELMPISDFPGSRNWGYDGVLPFAPDSSYGHPDDLKDLIQSCHQKGLMMLLDVVYNHFGPEGNYLNSYAPAFFTDRYRTPWGNAINFDGPGSRIVRDFFICNALYWLEEFHFDGLRLDAVHSIADQSNRHIMRELAEAVRTGPGRDRYCHLVLENWKNEADYLKAGESGTSASYAAQWNDDWHHSVHVLATGERDGYYLDYIEKPVWYLGRCLTEGFAYQGEMSAYHDNVCRGEPSSDLPLTSFVIFLQNHDQIGNRAFGERIGQLVNRQTLAAISSILLLSPSPPMLFMGEEFESEQPFLYFCDFEPELAKAVSRGRREEFARFLQFGGSQESIPDPADLSSFISSKLDWEKLAGPEENRSLGQFRRMLEIRRRKIVPLLKEDPHCRAGFELIGDRGLVVHWTFKPGSRLQLLANLGDEVLEKASEPKGEIIYSTGEFPGAWSVTWSLNE